MLFPVTKTQITKIRLSYRVLNVYKKSSNKLLGTYQNWSCANLNNEANRWKGKLSIKYYGKNKARWMR